MTGILDNTENAVINITIDNVGANGFANSLENNDTSSATSINAHINTNYTTYALDNTKNGCGVAMITQVYWKGSEKIIEVTNKETNKVLVPYGININLFNGGNTTSRAATVANTSEITGDNSILFSTSGGLTAQIKTGITIIEDVDVTGFDSNNDILTLSRNGTAGSTLAWETRTDVVQGLTNNTSFLRIDEILTPNTTFNTNEWVAFLDDNLPTSFNDFQRHPHDPLLSEITSGVNTEANALLGLHRFGATIRTGNVWSNGYPDRSRHVIIIENYEHSNFRLSARKLEIQGSSKLSIDNQPLVVTNNIQMVAGSEIRLVGTSQLVQTHEGISDIVGTGKLYIDQNSDLASIYRYNYMSSPVNSIGLGTYTVSDVFKDGTNALSSTGIVGQGDLNIARTINWVAGYDGSTGTPINLADYWIYTFASADGIRSSWSKKGKDGIIPATDGFIFKGPGVAQNYTFVGSPKDGELITAVGGSESYLVGNPFASSLNGLKFIQDNINSIDGTLYFWNHVGEEDTSTATSGHNYGGYIGGYATLNLSMGVSSVSKVSSGVYSIKMEAEDAYTDGITVTEGSISAIRLDAVDKYVEYKSITKATDKIDIDYKSIAGGSLRLKIDNVVSGTFSLPASPTYTNFTIETCVQYGTDIRLELVTGELLIDSVTISDDDGDVSCSPSSGINNAIYKTPGIYIPVGQGFFIGGDNDGGPIVFNNSQREFIEESSGQSVFFKSSKKNRSDDPSNKGVFNRLPMIKLGMNFINDEGENHHRQIGISFSDVNSFSYNKGYDSEIYDLGKTDIYWKFPNEEKKYVIAGIQAISDDLEVPFDIVMNYDGIVTLEIDENNTEKDIYIKDKLNNKIYQVVQSEIALQLVKGTYAGRFSLAFDGTVLSTEDSKNIVNKEMLVYFDDDSKEFIVRNFTDLAIDKITLYNVLGQKIHQWNSIKQAREIRLKVKSLQSQLYILNIKTNKESISKKILIK